MHLQASVQSSRLSSAYWCMVTGVIAKTRIIPGLSRKLKTLVCDPIGLDNRSSLGVNAKSGMQCAQVDASCYALFSTRGITEQVVQTVL